MMNRSLAAIMMLLASYGALAAEAPHHDFSALLPTGQAITPLAAPEAVFTPLVTGIGPNPAYVADGAAAIVMSPDKHEMLVLTSGFNRYVGSDSKIVPAQSGQYIFVYRTSVSGAQLQQTLTVPNSFSGITWAPDSKTFYVGGGVDDMVYTFSPSDECFAPLVAGHCSYVAAVPIKLNHKSGNGVEVRPQAAGVAVSPDGQYLLVTNYYNDSVSLINLKTRALLAEQDLRPGKIDFGQVGIAGGEYPFAVVWRDNNHAYVSAARDREIIGLTMTGTNITVSARIKTIGEPTALLYDLATAQLFATEDNADRVAIIDTKTNALIAEPKIGLPESLAVNWLGKGLNPNSLSLTPNHQLLVTLGGINALAIVAPRGADTEIVGLVPTGWYPSGVTSDETGQRIFVINRKSPPGPNPQGCAPRMAVTKAQPDACGAANQYIFQLEKAGLLQFAMPTPHQLVRTTLQVADNIGLHNNAARAAANLVMARLRTRIKHVIYIVKENRTYDQVLGDLEIGNGDPSLAMLGRSLSPNHHDLARQFVTLDNFFDSGEQSSTGWTWSTAARTTDLLEKTAPVNYAQRGLAYDAEEADRNIATLLSPAERVKVNPKMPADAELLPGPALATAPDADDDELHGQGFIWNQAVRAGLSVRNYGVADASVYDAKSAGAVPIIREPFKAHHVIYTAGDRDFITRSDRYFRGFDQKMPDYWRELEWEREFNQQSATNKMPAFTMMRLSHDHFGDFDTAIDKVNTVETQMADNDYALGRLIERVAKSPFARSTLIFVVEDDAQNGADHVDARRSIAYVVGAYVKHHALVSTRYTTINMLRTIEGVLGLKPMGMNDALAMPMAAVFDLTAPRWSYTAHAARVLMTTDLPIPHIDYVAVDTALTCPMRTAAYWAAAMKGQDFSSEDRLNTTAFNAALWQGLAPKHCSDANLVK